MLAASNNHATLVSYLISQGADINQVEHTRGWTALIWAAKQGHLETVQILLQHKAETDHLDLQGKRAIDWAMEGRFQPVAKVIREAA